MSALIGSIVALVLAGLAIFGIGPHEPMHLLSKTLQPQTDNRLVDRTVTAAPTPAPQTITVNEEILNLIPVPNGDNTDWSGWYYKNNIDVYLKTYYGKLIKIDDADPQSFTIDIPNNIDLSYSFDDHAVYYYGKKIFDLSSPETQFKILAPGGHVDCDSGPYVSVYYANRVTLVYYENQLIPGADADSFESLGTAFSKDKYHVFTSTTTTSYDPTTFDAMKASSFCSIG